MFLIFAAQLLAVLLVFNPLLSLVQSISLEVVNLLLSQWDTPCGQQVFKDIIPDSTLLLGVQGPKRRQQLLMRSGGILIGHQPVDQEWLKLVILDELGWLIIFQLHDNVVGNLNLRWELQQISHEIGNLSLI